LANSSRTVCAFSNSNGLPRATESIDIMALALDDDACGWANTTRNGPAFAAPRSRQKALPPSLSRTSFQFSCSSGHFRVFASVLGMAMTTGDAATGVAPFAGSSARAGSARRAVSSQLSESGIHTSGRVPAVLSDQPPASSRTVSWGARALTRTVLQSPSAFCSAL
jgi:hypothetical protein